MSGGWPLALAALAGALVLGALWWREHREAARLRRRLGDAVQNLERLQRSFARFAPEPLVERVIARGLATDGEKREVTALFVDLVGFTPMAEALEPTLLVEVLNGYFERMSRAVSDHRGHVTTFLGDGILALFGAFEPNPWQGDDAVHAALAMRGALADYNRELAARGLPPLALGVGAHRGIGVAGLVGSREKREFAIVGRTVNVAARVQDHTRRHDADVLVTEDLKRTLDPRFRLRALPPAELKGIAEAVALYAVERFEA